MRRRYLQYMIVGVLCSLSWIGCTETERLDAGEGILRMKVSVDPYVEVVDTRALTSEEQATLENNCEIRIYSGKGLVRYYKGLAQMPEELQLTSGSYTAQVTAGDSVSAAFDKSYYKGTGSFAITKGNVTNQEVTCKIANVLAAVNFGENVGELFQSYTMTVFTKLGSLEFTQENIGAVGYYMLSEGETTFQWKFNGVLHNGNEFERSGIVDAEPATRYDLNLNFATDGYEDGGASLQVIVNVTPLETIEDEVEFKQRPLFKGVGFDIMSPYIYAVGSTNELSYKIAVTSALTDATLACDKFTDWGFENNILQLANVSEEERLALEERGLQLVPAFDGETGAGLLTVAFTPTLIQKMTTEEASYVLALTATDAAGKTNSGTLSIVVSDVAVLTREVNICDVWTSRAILRGELIYETTEPLSFNYRIKGTTNWENVAAVRDGDTMQLSAHLTNLQPGTEYEYQAVAGITPSAVIGSFATEPAVQLPNSGFENWSGSSPLLIYGEGEEMFWDSGNHGASTLGGNVTTQDTSIRHSGMYSAKLQSQFIGIAMFGKFAAGNIFAGKYLKTVGTDGILGWGRDFYSRPKALRGYIRYVSGEVNYPSEQIASGSRDQGIIYVALGDWKKEQDSNTKEYWPVIIKTKASERQLFDPSENNKGIIAYGEQIYYDSTEGSEMIEFTINLDYRVYDRKPTSIVVVASASRYGDYFAGSTGSTLWLDDLELIYE